MRSVVFINQNKWAPEYCIQCRHIFCIAIISSLCKIVIICATYLIRWYPALKHFVPNTLMIFSIRSDNVYLINGLSRGVILFCGWFYRSFVRKWLLFDIRDWPCIHEMEKDRFFVNSCTYSECHFMTKSHIRSHEIMQYIAEIVFNFVLHHYFYFHKLIFLYKDFRLEWADCRAICLRGNENHKLILALKTNPKWTFRIS